MKFVLMFILMLLMASTPLQPFAQAHRYDPPWNTPPKSALNFTIPGVDNVPDLYGDINNAQLVIFFAGNQYMCVGDLIEAFKRKYPQYQRVFAETLPPGILAQQIEGGSITIGNLRITLQADVYTAGKSRMLQMLPYVTDTATYAFNKLAIMVAKGNPKHIHNLNDLGKAGVRVSMPNPEWEGIAKRIEEAYIKAGGDALKKRIMVQKVQNGSAYLTQIHHRQTPMRIMYGESDAGPVWYSEAFYQQSIGHPLQMVTLPESQNVNAIYMAGLLKKAPHAQAGKDFLQFLKTDTAKAIYRKYGFTTP
ncbi:molybdate ABC transporter substrate-binding protein [Hydrotalea sp.]|uniref:molybdate ABC transporter substrate-binding protein n=1 Tax=Hydrotalea sp. TaxID=2881279 RepID=UPI003D0C8E3A